MHVEVLTEDKSGSYVLDGLMVKLLRKARKEHTWAVRPHRGKGHWPKSPMASPRRMASGLLDLLPAKLRAYESVFSPQQLLLVVVLDADDEPPAGLRDKLRSLAVLHAPTLPVIIGLSVEEMESWLLGDFQAIARAYPKADRSRMQHYQQDSVCGTWQILAEVLLQEDAQRLIEIGYPAVGQYKSEWAQKIVPYMEPERNRSPSFQEFRSQLEKALQEGIRHGNA